MSKTSCTNLTPIPLETSRPGKEAQRLPKLSKCILMAINCTPATSNQSNSPSNPQVFPKEYHTWNHEEPPKDISHILKLLLHISLLIMVLTWPIIQYIIKVASFLGIFTINCLVPPMDEKLMVRHRRTRVRL